MILRGARANARGSGQGRIQFPSEPQAHKTPKGPSSLYHPLLISLSLSLFFLTSHFVILLITFLLASGPPLPFLCRFILPVYISNKGCACVPGPGQRGHCCESAAVSGPARQSGSGRDGTMILRRLAGRREGERTRGLHPWKFGPARAHVPALFSQDSTLARPL